MSTNVVPISLVAQEGKGSLPRCSTAIPTWSAASSDPSIAEAHIERPAGAGTGHDTWTLTVSAKRAGYTTIVVRQPPATTPPDDVPDAFTLPVGSYIP